MVDNATTPKITSTRVYEDLTVVTVHGAVSFEQVRAQIVGFLTNEPTPYVLWDFCDGTLAEVSLEQMRSLVSAGAPFAGTRSGGRTAIVSPSDVNFGLSRMFQTFAELHDIPFEIKVFRDIAPAMRWLKPDGQASEI